MRPGWERAAILANTRKPTMNWTHNERLRNGPRFGERRKGVGDTTFAEEVVGGQDQGPTAGSLSHSGHVRIFVKKGAEVKLATTAHE